MFYTIFVISIAVLSAISFVYYVLNSYSSIRYSSKINPDVVDLSKVTIAMPVYNEKIEVFRESIDSIMMQGCKFVVVGDSSYEPYKTIVEERGGLFIHQPVRSGQKKTIVKSMEYIDTPFLLLMDSDTILPQNAVKSMMSNFTEGVGGVGANLSIKPTGTAIAYCQEFIERAREVVFRAMSAHGSVLNLDGACVMFKTDIIKPFILSPEFAEFKVLGKPTLLGEDWLLTDYLIKNDYKAVKDYNTKVEVYPPEKFGKFIKQHSRWARSNWIKFAKELKEGTAMKAGWFYTFELVYTYLLPIIALGFGIFRLTHFMMIHHTSLQYINLIHDVFLLRHSDAGYILYTRLALFLANIGGTAIFLSSVAYRMRGERLKTLGYGGLAAVILFVTTIYGLLTFWKGKKWNTR